MAISMLKIRRPLGRLIFNMGIATPGKTVFLIETAPWARHRYTDYGRIMIIFGDFIKESCNSYYMILVVFRSVEFKK